MSRSVGLRAASALMMFIGVAALTGTAHAESHGGPCGGASAPSQLVQIHVVGKQAQRSMKFIAHFASDSNGAVTGQLQLGRGAASIYEVSWCRLWSSEESKHEGAIVTHVLGTMTSPSGEDFFVRVDLQQSDVSKVRVRTRSISGHDDHDVASDEAHAGWNVISGEGWLTTTRARISPLR